MEPQATKEGDNEVKNQPTTCKKELKKEVAQKKKRKEKRRLKRVILMRLWRLMMRNILKYARNTCKRNQRYWLWRLFGVRFGCSQSIFSDQVVRSFDPDRVSLVLDKNQEIDITQLDIHLVYGLPMAGELIEEPYQEIDETWKEFLRRWRGLFGMTSGSPLNSNVIAEIERLKYEPVSKDFLLHFIICAVNCCIRSTANPSLNYKFLYSCMDTTKIKHLNWCEYAYRSLISSTIEWQDGSAFFTGPLPFLMICYFDRLQRSKIENPRQFPLISIWKKELIKERMKIENKRGFGKGLVIDRMQKIQVQQNEQQFPEDSSKSTKEIMVSSNFK
ncbi:Elastase [Bienertia sinuspersici]